MIFYAIQGFFYSSARQFKNYFKMYEVFLNKILLRNQITLILNLNERMHVFFLTLKTLLLLLLKNPLGFIKIMQYISYF